MKKTSLLSCACMVLLGFSACSDHDEFIDKRSSALAIQVGVSADRENRSVIYGESLPDGAEIGIFLEGDNAPKGQYDGLVYSNCLYTAVGTDSDQKWDTKSSILLSPSIGTVYGYYPYNPGVTDMTRVPVDITNSEVDYMYALPTVAISMSNNKAYVVMNHVLCMVRLMIRKGSYTQEGVVSDVKLTCNTGLTKTGVLNARTGNLDQVGSAVSYSFQYPDRFTISGDYHVFPDFIGVPCKSLAPVTVEMMVDGRSYTCTSNITFEQGRIYVLNLQLDERRLTFTPSVEAWTDSPLGSTDIAIPSSIRLMGNLTDISISRNDTDGKITLLCVPKTKGEVVNKVRVESSFPNCVTQSSDSDTGILTVVISNPMTEVVLYFNGVTR